MGAAFADWWANVQTMWPWAFPGCNFRFTTYPNGSATNFFANWSTYGTCGGGNYMSGTLVTPAGSPSCPAGYTLTGNQCVISLTATIAQTLEPLTIALSGMGIDVMPTKKLAVYAKVSKSDGSAKSGAYVDLVLTVVPENGDPVRAEHVGSVSPNGGSTDAAGKLSFVFTAPTAGGTHTVSAFCTASGCTNYAEGKIKVPGCPVKDLPPITDPEVQLFEDNPDLSDIKDLTDAMKTALQRLQAAVTTAGSSSSVGSAYRPPAYNQHLIDVWKKWMYELKNNDKPACVALKTKIQAHFKLHKLKESQSPVPGSRHTLGEAVDVTISPDIPNIDTLARDCCNLRRPVPVDDPVHFQFP